MVIRSPKWLRKIFDFEFVTGKDLYPEVQLQRKKIEQRELDESIKQKNLLKSWNEEWSKLLDNKNSDLRNFFEKYLREKGLYKTHLSYLEGKPDSTVDAQSDSFYSDHAKCECFDC